MKNFNTQIHIRVFLLVVFVFVGPYILCSSQEEEDILTALMEEKGQKALYYAIQGFVRKWWYGSDLYPDPCSWTPIQALPNQQTVDCPSFKLVIVGDGGTDSRPKLIAGSPDGYLGLMDGKPREARMNHPKGITVDHRGNIYIAYTLNMAIRKISDAGVVTIVGGKWSRGGGHLDCPSEDAKFSDDFDVVYVGSSCSLLVADRGNQAIRDIQLREDDCVYHYNGNQHLGITVLVAAGFFGYKTPETKESNPVLDALYMRDCWILGLFNLGLEA